MAIGRRKDPNSYYSRLTLLKKLFWLYFLLLIFEGVLRKWVVPQLSAPLLIVRDPVSLWIIWEAYRTHKWPTRWSAVSALLAVGLVVLFVVQIVTGDNPWFVGLYGLRSYLLPFPVVFIMGENLDREDLHRMGACTLWLLLPITGLEVAQYLSPPLSFLNRGTIAGGGQIVYAQGHIRPPGPFSFSVGAVSYGVLAASFLFYGLVRDGLVKKWLLFAAAFALILSIPILGARTFVFQLLALLACVAIGGMFGLSQFGRTIKVMVPLLIIAGLTSLLPVFSNAMDTLTTRFAQADAVEGSSEKSIDTRVIDPVISAFAQTDVTSNWMGEGMGRGATAMSFVLTGRAQFLAGEMELTREFAELGPMPAMLFLIFRLLLAVGILGRALAGAKVYEPLALLLLPLSLSMLIFGILEQPTDQGFMVISMAFTLAALKFGVVPVSTRAVPFAQPRRRPIPRTLSTAPRRRIP